MKIVIEQFESYHKINKKIPIDVVNNLKTHNEGNKIADVVTVNLNIPLSQKQELLELISTIWLEYDNYDRMEEVLDEIKKDNQKEN